MGLNGDLCYNNHIDILIFAPFLRLKMHDRAHPESLLRFIIFPLLMSEENGLSHYDESPIKQESISASVYKRPGMYFGDMDDGTGYSVIVSEIVSTILSWKAGANMAVTLRPEAIEITCRARLPDSEILFTDEGRKPFFVYGDQLASLGFGWFTAPLHAHAFACRQALWESRDSYGEQSALFDEGICRSAQFSAPDLPDHLCLRVSLSIGTVRLPFAPATIDQVCKRLRYMGGPAEAGYWGCVTVRDERTRELQIVMVTDPPPRLSPLSR